MIKAHDEIEGWFDFQDVYKNIVDDIVDEEIDAPIIVEIGSFKGKSAVYMAEYLKQLKMSYTQFYCVDTWRNSPSPEIPPAKFSEFMDNVKSYGVDKFVLPVEKPSRKAARLFLTGSIHAVYIDASHEFVDVCEDIYSWYSKLSRNAVFFGGHDIYWGEVRLAVERFCKLHDRTYKIIGNSWSLDL
jgi:hypothetical protein